MWGCRELWEGHRSAGNWWVEEVACLLMYKFPCLNLHNLQHKWKSVSPEGRENLCTPAFPGLEYSNVSCEHKITASHNNNHLHHIFRHQSQTKNSYESLTLTFMVLWFFLVFLRNCFRLPDDMYSVMNTTCEGYKKKSYFDIMATSDLYQNKNNSFRKKSS